MPSKGQPNRCGRARQAAGQWYIKLQPHRSKLCEHNVSALRFGEIFERNMVDARCQDTIHRQLEYLSVTTFGLCKLCLAEATCGEGNWGKATSWFCGIHFQTRKKIWDLWIIECFINMYRFSSISADACARLIQSSSRTSWVLTGQAGWVKDFAYAAAHSSRTHSFDMCWFSVRHVRSLLVVAVGRLQQKLKANCGRHGTGSNSRTFLNNH